MRAGIEININRYIAVVSVMRIHLIVILIVAAFTGCENDDGLNPGHQQEVYIRFAPMTNTKVAGDSDNLPKEYEIKNLSIFLTDRGSTTVSHKFVYQSISSIDNTSIKNYKQVVLPLDPASVTNMDVYVISNYTDAAALNMVQTLGDIRQLKTPSAPISGDMVEDQGLPMYGQALNTNLSNTSAANPAEITLIRACAKLRISVTFTDVSWIGTDNGFMVENAMPYTFYVKNDSFDFNPSDLIAYPRIELDQNQTNVSVFEGIAYLYEALYMPKLHIYTTIDGSPKDYVLDTNLPVPVRNNLYDLQVQIFPSDNTQNRVYGYVRSISSTGIKVFVTNE
jgi:hypothetical protein